jgi:hypothetical protein
MGIMKNHACHVACAALLAGVGAGAVGLAQDRRTSPRHTVSATLAGGTDISVTYGRPSKRGRTIFGSGGSAVVPYGAKWRTGADEATVLITSRALRLQGHTLAAGRYRLYTIPGERSWKFVLDQYHGQWGTDYDARSGSVSVTCPASTMALPREQLTLVIASGATARTLGELRLEWDTVSVACIIAAAPVAAAARHPYRPEPIPDGLAVKAARERLWNNAYLTVAPNVTVEGPLYGALDDATYNRQVLALLLHEADAIATTRGYRLPGLWRKYATFLLGSLAVPWHESRWMHARVLPTWLCSEELQKGPSSATHQQVFAAHLAARGQLADCTSAPGTRCIQLLDSQDTVSTGIMQVAFRYHEPYYKDGAHLNMKAAVRYGLTFYARGFQRIWNTADGYPCLMNNGQPATNDGPRAFDVLRAAWAGAYNHAAFANDRYTNACRFAGDDRRDAGFSSALAFMRDDRRFGALGLDRAERAVIDDLLAAIEHNTEPAGALRWIEKSGS